MLIHMLTSWNTRLIFFVGIKKWFSYHTFINYLICFFPPAYLCVNKMLLLVLLAFSLMKMAIDFEMYKTIFSWLFFKFSNKMSNIINNQICLLEQYEGGLIFLAHYLWHILSVFERWMADIKCVCLRKSDIFDSAVWRWLLFYLAFFVWEKIKDVPKWDSISRSEYLFLLFQR